MANSSQGLELSAEFRFRRTCRSGLKAFDGDVLPSSSAHHVEGVEFGRRFDEPDGLVLVDDDLC